MLTKGQIRILTAFMVIVVFSMIVQLCINIKTKKQIEQLQTIVVELDSINQKQQTKINQLQSEIEIMKESIDSVNHAAELVMADGLKHQVFSYLDQKFQSLPKRLATLIAEYVVDISLKEDIPVELTLAMIQVESSFNPMAISSKNARGLMQLMPEWAPKFNLKKVSDLHDIDTNIQCGLEVLKIHIKEGGDLSKGLYRYVGGDSTYASRVFEAMGKFVAFRSALTDEKVRELATR